MFGVDYNLIFAAVINLATVMLILILIRLSNVPARQGDVPNAHVKAEKEESPDIYVKIPKSMQVSSKELQVSGCSPLVKSRYC